MKSFFLNIAASLAFLLNLNSPLLAQTTATWQGGKPGRPTDWNCAANWREGKTPDEFTQVIIPSGMVYFPVIKGASESIDALLLEGGSELTLKRGAGLTILCETGRFDGITLLGEIRNDGSIELCKKPQQSTVLMQRIVGSGRVVGLDSSGAASIARK